MEQKGVFVNKDFQPEILLTVFKKNWLWIPFMTALLVAGAFIYLRYTKPIFESTAVIQIGSKDQGKEVIGLENLNTKKGLSEAIELMRSEFLFRRAIHDLNLNISYFSKGKFLTEERYLQSSFIVTPFNLKDSTLCQTPIFIEKKDNDFLLKYVHKGQSTVILFKWDELIEGPHFSVKLKLVQRASFMNELQENQIYFIFNDPNHLTRKLLPNLTINPLNTEAKTIQISYRSNNSSLSKDIVEAVYKSFFTYDEEVEKLSSQNVLRFIDQQLDSLERELRNSKDSIQHFQKISNIPNPDQLETSLSERINQLSSEVFGLEMELQTLRSLEQRITNNPNRIEVYQLIPELIGKSFESTLFSQVEDLHNLLEKRDDLAFSLTTESPEYKKAAARIEQRISTIRQSIGAIKERLNARIVILNQQLRQFDSEVFQIPEKKMELSRLKNIQDLNEKYFMLLMDKRSVYSISNAGYASKNIVLKSSETNNTAVSPNKKIIYGAALFISLLISFAVIALKYLMHNEINSLEDLTMALPTVSVLGSVPLNKTKTEFSKLVVADSPKSMIAEAFRGIRSNLNFINPDTRTIAVSSSISGEGKTFVCLNLAGILAMAGKKVVLIDLDLRKPKVHHGFEVENNIGMSTLLSGQSNIADSIKQSSLKNLYFIAAGPIPPNPSELILSEKMNETVEELKQLFDIIIIDNPPVGIVSDGIGLLATADCPIYVFKANYSKRSFIYRVKELIEVQKVKGLSVILNAVEMNRNRYGYGYGYGNYYEETPQKKWWQKIFKK